jgi:hypothetical protein
LRYLPTSQGCQYQTRWFTAAPAHSRARVVGYIHGFYRWVAFFLWQNHHLCGCRSPLQIHFTPLKHPYTAAQVAQTFFEVIFKLHGIPSSIVCDRDPVFTGIFWRELFRLHGTKFNFSSAYHLQTDGQTEVVNRTIEMYLRCFTNSSPNRWAKWLPWVEYCYNTGYHSATKWTPF